MTIRWRTPTGPRRPARAPCIVIVATDAPLLPGQCKALARRVPLGLARTGTSGSHFSGDLFLAFSTANVGMLDSAIDARGADDRLPSIEFIGWGQLDPLFEAVVQSVEEAVLNALVAARTMFGRDNHRSPGIPDRTTPLAAQRLSVLARGRPRRAPAAQGAGHG